jgi:hypothetical protein
MITEKEEIPELKFTGYHRQFKFIDSYIDHVFYINRGVNNSWKEVITRLSYNYDIK